MYRINKTEKGYFVEIQCKKWYGFKYWKPFITYYSRPSDTFYFKTYKGAMKALVFKIEWDTNVNSVFFIN